MQNQYKLYLAQVTIMVLALAIYCYEDVRYILLLSAGIVLLSTITTIREL